MRFSVWILLSRALVRGATCPRKRAAPRTDSKPHIIGIFCWSLGGLLLCAASDSIPVGGSRRAILSSVEISSCMCSSGQQEGEGNNRKERVRRRSFDGYSLRKEKERLTAAISWVGGSG